MIRAIFLDAGGVLLLPAPALVVSVLAEAGLEIRPDAVPEAHYQGMVGYDRRREQAGVNWNTAYAQAFVAHVGGPPSRAQAAVDNLASALLQPGAWSHLMCESVDTLPALAAAGHALAVVSNSDGTVATRLASERVLQVGPGPGTPVTSVIDSAQVGVAKPDPRIFELALAACRARPEEAVHVGDSVLADVEGARAAGIRPLHLDPFRLCSLTDHEHLASLRELPDLLARC